MMLPDFLFYNLTLLILFYIIVFKIRKNEYN